MLIEPLALDTPLAGFNGGLMVEPDMSVLEQRVIPDELVAPIIALLESEGIDVWLYRGAGWYVLDLQGAHVQREARTVQFQPTEVQSFDGLMDGVAKLVGVSDDFDAVARRLGGGSRRVRRPRLGLALAALLRGRDPPRGEQGRGGQVPSVPYEIPTRADRHHRRHAQRRAHVRALRPEHRHGQRRYRGAARRPPHNDVQRGRGLRRPRSSASCSPTYGSRCSVTQLPARASIAFGRHGCRRSALASVDSKIADVPVNSDPPVGTPNSPSESSVSARTSGSWLLRWRRDRCRRSS